MKHILHRQIPQLLLENRPFVAFSKAPFCSNDDIAQITILANGGIGACLLVVIGARDQSIVFGLVGLMPNSG
jgi:hypothetical protein